MKDFRWNYKPLIPKDQLVDGGYYRGRCRNANIARWDAKTQKFYHWRTKWGGQFVESIHCPEDDNVFDVFVAEVPITPTSIEEIPIPSKDAF